MSWLWRIAERAMERARDSGDLDNLPGEGRPLDLVAPDAGVDAVEAAGYRLMKAEGAIPPEVVLHRKAAEERRRLAEAVDPIERKAAMAALAKTQMRLSMMAERRMGRRRGTGPGCGGR